MGALAVDRLAERVDHATDQFATDRHRRMRPVDLTTSPSGDVLVGTSTTAPTGPARGFSARPKVLPGNSSISPCITSGKTMHAADTVGHRDHRALGPHFRANIEVRDLAPNQFADFEGFKFVLQHGLFFWWLP